MALTYVALASVTVGSGGAASIEFTSIPQTYTDLLIDINDRSDSGTGAGERIYVRFNGATNDNNLSSRRLYSLSNTPGSDSLTTVGQVGWGNVNSMTANAFGSTQIYIPNYAGSTNKSMSIDTVTENNSSTYIMGLITTVWADTSAITSINLRYDSAGYKFAQYTTVYLYGIKNTV